MMQGFRIRVLVSVAVFAGATLTSAQAPFALDTTFRTQFDLHPVVSPYTNQYVASVLPLPDGRVIASGRMRFPGEFNDRGGAILNADGSLYVGSPLVMYMGGRITPWQDRFYCGNGQGVRRIMMNGTLDPTFSTMGVPYFMIMQGGDYHVFPDGRLVLSGAHMLSDTVRGYTGLHMFTWITNTGQLDTTRIHRKANGVVYRFKELPDGKFIASGVVSSFEGQPCGAIFRLHSDGALDTTFQTGMNLAYARAYLPLEDGRVYVGGRFLRAGAPQDTLHLVRFLPDGSLDPTFNPPHFTMGDIPDPGGWGASIEGIASWSEGRLVITGDYQRADGHERRAICMLDSTGALLNAFDGHGVWLHIMNTPGGGTQSFAYLNGIMPYDSTRYLVYGGYRGYGDGQTLNDTLQNYITRIYGGEGPFWPVGVAEQQARNADLRVYPNPASDIVIVEWPEALEGGVLLLRDALGREVRIWPARGGKATLELEGWSEGVYIIELRSQDGKRLTQRLVVQ
jgi:uncharacterized delta-60 repeat protein